MTVAQPAGAGRAGAELTTGAADTIAKGSKSFAAAARLFDADTRESVILLYAWCRHCDDVIDGQDLGHATGAPAPSPPELLARLEALREGTLAALAGRPPDVPAFRALAEVNRRHALPQELPLAHLAGFAMDVEGRTYGTFAEVLDYCYGVAGVVGEMMSVVMGARAPETLVRAADLGRAFQLTNIARDIVPDAHAGRVYLPAAWRAEEGLAPSAAAILGSASRPAVARLARRLVESAEPFYASARLGIDALPRRSAWAVATAMGVYREIGLRVVERGERAWDTRVSTSGFDKLRLAAKGSAIAFGPRNRT